MLEWLAGQPTWITVVAFVLPFLIGGLLGRLSKKSVTINTGGITRQLKRIADGTEKPNEQS